ncbi:MAG TPA: CPBP family intramembrane glutamic endopeptidase [Candidatus Krumholzibacteria bacterium]|nr:CPBP family intramembrane glutamic endopeptidase [Candidatus Krumholzibacteria bacterium]
MKVHVPHVHIERRGFQYTTIGVVLISFALMVVAGLENRPAPWAPFYVIYAALATWLPLQWKTVRFGPVRAVRWWMWAACPVIAILLQAMDSVLVNVVYARIVVALGGPESLSNSIIGVPAMFSALFRAGGAHLGISAKTVQMSYLGFLVAWAGFGEEVYFRGYVQGVLRRHHSARYAITVATLLFAVRHYMQMLLLFPTYPVFAATAWCATAIPLGFAVGYIYEHTDSLWMPVTIHYLFNIIPFLAG